MLHNCCSRSCPAIQVTLGCVVLKHCTVHSGERTFDFSGAPRKLVLEAAQKGVTFHHPPVGCADGWSSCAEIRAASKHVCRSARMKNVIRTDPVTCISNQEKGVNGSIKKCAGTCTVVSEASRKTLTEAAAEAGSTKYYKRYSQKLCGRPSQKV